AASPAAFAFRRRATINQSLGSTDLARRNEVRKREQGNDEQCLNAYHRSRKRRRSRIATHRSSCAGAELKSTRCSSGGGGADGQARAPVAGADRRWPPRGR